VVAVKGIAREYWANRPMELAAALSYYTILAVAPLVLITVAVAGLVFERATVEGRIITEMRVLVGDEGAEVAHTVLRNANSPEKGARSVAIGIVFLLVGASTVFVQLQDSLNRIWKVDGSTRSSGVRTFLKERLLSVALILGIGFLLLISLVVDAGLSAVGESARATEGDLPPVLQFVNTLGSLIVITLLFAMIFKILPDAAVAWRDVWFGAVTTSVLFTFGKYLIGLYLGRAGIGSAYGAAGSFVVLTVWVYYASMIVLFGAQLTYVRSRHRRGGGGAWRS
jgi:membrane protein